MLTNVGQSDINLSPLALPCSRNLLVHGGVYCLPYDGWIFAFLHTYLVFPSSREKIEFHDGIWITDHFIQKWASLHYHPVV